MEKIQGNIGVSRLLLVAFIILKLCDVIQWSWWWVLSPLWISLGIAILCFIVAGLIWFFVLRRK